MKIETSTFTSIVKNLLEIKRRNTMFICEIFRECCDVLWFSFVWGGGGGGRSLQHCREPRPLSHL